MIDFETVKQQTSLTDYATANLQQVGRGFVCPACGSGTGKHKTPAFTIDPKRPNRWKCFSCGKGGDVFDLAGIVHNTDNRIEQLKEVALWAHIPLEDDCPRQLGDGGNRQVTPEKQIKPPTDKANKYAEGRKRERAYVLETQEALKSGAYPEAIAYLEGRGFTFEEAVRLGFGFDPNAQSSKDSAGNWIGGGRIVIPWQGSTYYHIDRAINPDTAAMKYTKPKSDDVGSQPIYNPQALKSDTFFLVEGALDAKAIELLGYEAIALGNADAKAVSAYVASNHYRGIIIGFLDDDKAGKQGSLEAAQLIEAAGIAYQEIDRGDVQGKDAAEMLAADRDALKALLEANNKAARDELEREREREYRETLSRFRIADLESVSQKVYTLEGACDDIPTGFEKLDDILGGGLTNWLYIFGAASSMGKTTFISQMADQIAANGYPVLFVSVEQGADEIAAKSFSRLLATLKGRTVSTSEILRPNRRAYWREKDYADLAEVIEHYTHNIAPNMNILEPYSQAKAGDIVAAANAIAQRKGRPPVVFVDYLQLLAPTNDRQDIRETVKNNVSILRQGLARELKTPAFVISSIGREQYAKKITLASFKESGDIEFSADAALGLQPAELTKELDDTSSTDHAQKKAADRVYENSKDRVERLCELRTIKQRHGGTPKRGQVFIFKALESRFEETEF